MTKPGVRVGHCTADVESVSSVAAKILGAVARLRSAYA